MTLTQAILVVLLAGAVVVAAGTRLARSADVIAARTHLGGAWVGSVLLAGATSLPELTTDIAAVRMGAVDLAAGDLFGSSMANMLILALVTLVPSGAELFRRATLDHVLYAALAIILTVIAGICVLVRPTSSFLSIGIGPLLLLTTYVVGSRAVFKHSVLAERTVATAEMSSGATPADGADTAAERAPLPSVRAAGLAFAASAVVILISAPFFARSAEAIAAITGVGSTFIGTWLVGFSTSLPELVTSLAAVRMRSYDLAAGNLFGSNAFNMSVWVVLDAVHGPGSIFSVVSPAHLVSALVAVGLMGVAVAALAYRAQGRFTLLEPSSALIVVGYVAGLGLLLMQSVGRVGQ